MAWQILVILAGVWLGYVLGVLVNPTEIVEDYPEPVQYVDKGWFHTFYPFLATLVLYGGTATVSILTMERKP